MKRLQYVGLKVDGERAFQERTGIEWMPGDEHDVKDEHAELMLPHTDVWKEVPPKAAALAAAPSAKKVPEPGEPVPLTDWAKKGIELGATDDQLEAIAQAGGPDTEAGAALWKDATGTDWKADADAGASKSQVKRVTAQKTAAKKTAKKAK